MTKNLYQKPSTLTFYTAPRYRWKSQCYTGWPKKVSHYQMIKKSY